MKEEIRVTWIEARAAYRKGVRVVVRFGIVQSARMFPHSYVGGHSSGLAGHSFSLERDRISKHRNCNRFEYYVTI